MVSSYLGMDHFHRAEVTASLTPSGDAGTPFHSALLAPGGHLELHPSPLPGLLHRSQFMYTKEGPAPYFAKLHKKTGAWSGACLPLTLIIHIPKIEIPLPWRLAS